MKNNDLKEYEFNVRVQNFYPNDSESFVFNMGKVVKFKLNERSRKLSCPIVDVVWHKQHGNDILIKVKAMVPYKYYKFFGEVSKEELGYWNRLGPGDWNDFDLDVCLINGEDYIDSYYCGQYLNK